jgi:two-component system, LytTR family, response regulator
MALRVFVVDDEAPARRKLLRFLKDDPEVSVVGEAANGREAVEAMRAAAPDLLFLDVQMPDLDGFEVLRQLAPGPLPQIVFVTAFDQYAIQAFDVHAFGYLLKPFDQPRFQKVLDDAKRHAAARDTDAARLSCLLAEMSRPPKPARLLVEQGERAIFLAIADIDWIAADRNYLVLHAGDQAYTVRGTMDAIEEKLEPAQFARVNRSTIVRIDFIRELQKWFHGEYRVVLKNGATATWTRRYLGRHPELLQSL